MSKSPEDHPWEYIPIPPDPNGLNGSAFPTLQPRATSMVELIHQRQELENLIAMHRTIQRRFDPVAHGQYWMRELSILNCEMRLAQLQIAFKYCPVQVYMRRALERLEYYLQDQKVIGSSLADLTTVVLKRASVDMFRRHPLLAAEDYAKEKKHNFHRLLKNALNLGVGHEMGWCPVIQSCIPWSMVRPTHIFPCWAGKHDTKVIFGDDATKQIFEDERSPETLSTANGLVLHESVAIALVNLWIVIVPAGPPGSDRWKTRVVKKDLLDRYMGVHQRKWRTIENQELNFHSYRPAARYLYWHYVTARLHASAGKPLNFWTNLMGDDCWPHHQQYIKLDYLDAYTERLGEFRHEKFNDLRRSAIQVRDVETFLDVRIAAKWMSDIMERQYERVRWIGGLDTATVVNQEDDQSPAEQADPSAMPVHVIGPNAIVDGTHPDASNAGHKKEGFLSIRPKKEVFFWSIPPMKEESPSIPPRKEESSSNDSSEADPDPDEVTELAMHMPSPDSEFGEVKKFEASEDTIIATVVSEEQDAHDELQILDAHGEARKEDIYQLQIEGNILL